MAARLTKRDVENTRTDLRLWAKQLSDISGKLSALVDELDQNGDGGNGGSGEARAQGPR